MNSKTNYQSRNFSISYFQRLALGGEWLGDLQISVQNWRHTINAFGGFDTGEFSIVESESVIEDWVMNGLGRGIVVYDETLFPVWEGFVNQISVKQAGLSLEIGPVLGIANRVKATYSGVDTSVYPPIIGVRKQTPTINDVVSQAEWGIWPTVLSLAGVTDSNADLLISMYLTEHAQPELTSDFSFGSAEVSMAVSCVGWKETLVYPYRYTATSGTTFVSTKIGQILDAQVNPGWIVADYSRFDFNPELVPQYDTDDRQALELIRGLAAMGDLSNNRYLFGVYEDRKPRYEKVLEEITYEIRLRDSNQRILDMAGAPVPPWRIRPGGHVFYSDFLPGLGEVKANLHQDPRVLHIESVTFDLNVPFSISLNGGHNSKYEQKSASLGLRGTDA